MQFKSTLNRISKLPRQVFMILSLFILATSIQAQTYTNGNLSTGATANNGDVAPTGTTWSEVQSDVGVTTVSNSVSGVVSSIALNVSVADDFTVPAGPSWDITRLTFYAYQTGAGPTPSPFNALRFQIFNTDPSVGTPTPIFGDLTTNRMTATNDAMMYRIFNTTVPAPSASGLTRKIWTLEATVTGLSLPPGTYWIEWLTGVTTGTHFSPPSTIPGARTAAGYNGIQHDLTANEWGLLQDGGNPATLLDTVDLDMPFKIDYTTNVCAVPPTITASPVSVTVCSGANTSFTATATGPTLNYQWQVSTDNGATFTNITNGGIYGGATTNTLTLTNVPFANNGYQYQLAVNIPTCTAVNSTAATLTVDQPNLTTQPTNVTACVGTDATFTAVATGTNLTYQWSVSTDGGATFLPVAGATAAALVVPAVTVSMDGYQYYVVVSNPCNLTGVTSSTATLTVSDVATITTSPVNTTICEGTNASFSATASAVTYQWQVSTDGGANFTDIAGETTLNLSLTAVTAAMSGYQYRLVAFSCGAAGINSAAATLTVNNLVSISAQPADVTVCLGNNADFSVTTDLSTTPITYQWEVSTDGGTTYTAVVGATSATLTITGVTAGMDGSLFHVVMSNGCTTSLISDAATLTVASASVITVQPVDASTCEGSSASFSVTATGSITGYQWQESTDGGANFVNIGGQTAATLTLAGATAAMNNNQYRVFVLDNCTATGVISDPATLTVNGLPTVVITAAPSVNITAQGTTTLTATSTAPATVFSWFKDGSLVPTATGSTIIVTHDELGEYYASVTDGNGCSNTSNTLTIGDSTASNAFIYPNPGRGIFNLVFDLNTGITNKVTVGAFDSKGSRVYQKQFNIVGPIQTIPVDLSALSKGVYVLEITDAAGVRIRTDRVVIY